MHHRRSAVVALCVLVALLTAACATATAAPGDSSSRQRTSEPEGQPASRPLPMSRDGQGPQWHLSPQWALEPEILPGSERFRELARKQPASPGEPTNVVLITTDDMTANELRWMPKTRALIGGAGVRFTDSISPHPLCCPARAEILTGQFAQNNGVRANKWPHGGYYALDSTNTLPVWLQQAGYQTAFMGKYLNQYGGMDAREVPPGWDHWQGLVRSVYDYYHYTLNVNGELLPIDGVYQTEYYADQTDRMIPRLAADERPFFLWQSHLAPHTACPLALSRGGQDCWLPPTPSVDYHGWYDDVRPPQRSKPSYNEADVSDKGGRIGKLPPMDAVDRRKMDELFQRRIESLRSVDDAVARTVDVLERTGELDNTLLIFTSDNGYLLGEHRYDGKIVPYEPSLRVPLLMRGPSVPAGVTRPSTVTTVDLAPTILAAAGAQPGLTVDGRNLLPVATGQQPDWETVLIQGGPRRADAEFPWLYRGVRTDRYTYVERRQTGERELYDRRRDPYQLHNVAGSPAYAEVQAELRRRLLQLQDCSGADCRQTFGPVPRPSGRPGP